MTELLNSRPAKLGEADTPSMVTHCIGSNGTAVDPMRIHGDRKTTSGGARY